jgi:hypothetical protein
MQQPGMPPFSPAAGTPPPPPPVGVAPSPISSRPPPEGQHHHHHQQQQQQQADDLGGSASSSAAAGAAAGGGGIFADHEGAAGGDEGERGGPSGNRWPRQETLALLKIRSEMDAAFREAALKGPLWEQVSRCVRACVYIHLVQFSISFLLQEGRRDPRPPWERRLRDMILRELADSGQQIDRAA